MSWLEAQNMYIILGINKMVSKKDDEWQFHMGIWDAPKQCLGFLIGLNERDDVCVWLIQGVETNV